MPEVGLRPATAKRNEAVHAFRQNFLTSGAGLPKNDAAFNQLIGANTKPARQRVLHSRLPLRVG